MAMQHVGSRRFIKAQEGAIEAVEAGNKNVEEKTPSPLETNDP